MAAAPASSSGSPDRAASAQTLGPLLRSWSFVEEHEESLGAPLAYAAATCPAIASVAAGFLVHQSVEQKIVALPDGTRKHRRRLQRRPMTACACARCAPTSAPRPTTAPTCRSSSSPLAPTTSPRRARRTARTSCASSTTSGGALLLRGWSVDSEELRARDGAAAAPADRRLLSGRAGAGRRLPPASAGRQIRSRPPAGTLAAK